MAKTTGSVATLSWSAKLDSNEFKKGVRKVKKEMKEAQKAVGQSLKMMAKGFAVVTGAVTGATVALGAMVKQSADVVNSQKILADSIGATQQEIAGLELASDSMGVSYDQLIDKMREIGGINEFSKLADDVASASSATESMRIAQEALGNEGLKLLPILQQGSAGLKAYSQEALKLGLALPEGKVNALTSAWGAFEKAMQMIRGLTRQLSAELVESFGRTFTLIQTIVETFRGNFIDLFRNINSVYVNFINSVATGIQDFAIPAWIAFQNIIGQVGKSIATLFNLFLSSPVEGTIDNWTIAIFDFGSTMRESLAFGLARVFQEVFKAIGEGLVNLLSFFNDIFQKLNKLFVKIGLKSEIQGIIDAIDSNLQLETLKKGVEDVGKEIKEVVDILEDDLELTLSDRIAQTDKLQKAFGFNLDKFENIRLNALNGGETGKDSDPVEVEVNPSSQNNVIATAGSVEEFNIMRSQRKEELNILKKIADNTSKTAKNQPQPAGF